MSARKKCGNAGSGQCKGAVKTVTDPFMLEIHGERIMITVCEKHLQERMDDI